MTSDLQALCEHAMREGRNIDLQGCSYGSRFLKKEFLSAPVDYYFLLAGLVRTLDMKHILELGTHWGGAIMSMCRGLRDPDSLENRLVTVDINYENADGFKSYPQIKRITGDSFDRRVVEAVVASFPRPLDLLFVDTEHDYRQTYRNLATYGNRLAPRLMVLDDIHFNHSMDRLWRDLKHRMGNRAFDASRLCNREDFGFGVLLWDPTAGWPERYGFLIDYWRARRWVMGRVPDRFKHLKCEALGLKRVTWLTLRRTYSSWAQHQKGVPGKVVAGHYGRLRGTTPLPTLRPGRQLGSRIAIQGHSWRSSSRPFFHT